MQVILQAFKTYGLILADNGSAWYISGVPDDRWDNDILHEMDVVTGADFEVVDTSSLMIDPKFRPGSTTLVLRSKSSYKVIGACAILKQSSTLDIIT